jgi:hypothetical protein
MNPQTAILKTSAECHRIARSLLSHAECLNVARPDSAIVKQAQVSLRRLAVELDNSAVGLRAAMLVEQPEADE